MKTIIPATSFPVSLAEAKHQLAYFHSEDDAHVQALIAIATEEAEEYTGVNAHFCTVEEKLAQFPAGMIVLSGEPFAAINTIKYYDADNNLQTLSSSLYRVYSHLKDTQIEIIDSWPSTYDREDAIVIEYVLGYASVTTADAETDTFTQAGHPFQNGDRVVVYGAREATIPAGITARKVYYVINRVADTFQLSTTADGVAVTITTNGTGQWYVGIKEVPRVMQQAILMMIAGLNEFRTDEITGTMISQVSMSSRYLLNHVKPKRL